MSFEIVFGQGGRTKPVTKESAKDFKYIWSKLVGVLWEMFEGKELPYQVVAVLPEDRVDGDDRSVSVEFSVLVFNNSKTLHVIHLRFADAAPCQIKEMIENILARYFDDRLLVVQQQLTQLQEIKASLLPSGAGKNDKE